MPNHVDALDRVITDVIAPNAGDVDQKGTFPRVAVDQLAAAGLLGLTSSVDVGGAGLGMRDAADVIERIAGVCGSTAMVVLMHYAATAVVEAHGSIDVRREIAGGRHLTTLAFSEVGSRSHFWAPLGTAGSAGGADLVQLDARKSWVTAAGEVASYVWSSQPVAAEGPMTLWLVPADTPGLTVGPPFDGLGLRGNASTSITGVGVVVPATARLAADGEGLDVALATALPWFLVLNSAFCLGLMEAVTTEAGDYLVNTKLEHLAQSLVQQPALRADFARMRLTTDTVRAFLADTLAALETGRADATLRVLEVKAAAGEAVLAATDLAMKVCGGAAFRKEIGIERRFRDARASRVMAPTTDALLDFVGRASSGLPLLDA